MRSERSKFSLVKCSTRNITRLSCPTEVYVVSMCGPLAQEASRVAAAARANFFMGRSLACRRAAAEVRRYLHEGDDEEGREGGRAHPQEEARVPQLLLDP